MFPFSHPRKNTGAVGVAALVKRPSPNQAASAENFASEGINGNHRWRLAVKSTLLWLVVYLPL